MNKSTQDSAGLFNEVTKRTIWRGGAQIFKKEEEDARLLDRYAARNGLRIGKCRIEEIGGGFAEKVARLYKAKTGVGCDGFHPNVPLDLTQEARREIVEFLEKVPRKLSPVKERLC